MGLLLSKESFVVYIVCIYNLFILPIYASICENENCSFSLEKFSVLPCFRGEDSAAPKTSSFISHGNFTIFKQIYLVNGRCRGLLVRFKPREFSVSNGGRVLAQTSMNHQGTLEISTIFTMAVDECGFSQNDNIHRMLATPILFPTNPRYLTTNSI